MDSFLQDVRYAGRTLAQNPGFAALAILCLALGIGVNSTIFSVVDTVSIRPLPFTAPHELVALHTTDRANGEDRGSISFLDLQEYRSRTRTFVDVAAITGRSLTLMDRDESERFNGSIVTWNLFPMLGIQPILGRQIGADEDTPGATPVIMLSHGVWQRRYAGDRSVIGRSISVNGTAHTVIAVMPPKFQFPEETDLWIPLTPLEYKSQRGARNLSVFARMKPGVAFDAARRDAASVGDALAKEHLEDKDRSATAVPLRTEFMDGDVYLIVFTMMGAVTLVLLIACANVANLLLARATVRQREMAVRAALGAGRGRIVRQLLTESVIIALLSTPLGVGIAYVGLQWLTASIPESNKVPYFIDWSMNPRVVVYTGIIAIVTGIVFGLAPALQAARINLQDSLKDRGVSAGGSRNRLRATLVVAEIGLSLILLVGASLFVRSFLNLQRARQGLDTSQLMLMRFYMPGARYDASDAMIRRVEDIVSRVETLPGVEAVFASNMVPLSGGGSGNQVIPEGVAMTPGDEPFSQVFATSPRVLKTLNVTLVAGRDFTGAEGRVKSAVAIVNGVFAKRMWPNEANAIGRRFRMKGDRQNVWYTVIGQVGDFRLFTVRDGKPPPYVFLSYPYQATRNTGLTIRVTGGAPPSVTAAVRQEIRKSDPSLAVFEVQTGDQARLDTFWQFRLFGWMFSIFGAIALALAAIGVYGVLSYAVSQRTQEIGVRMALGASRQDVFTLIVGHGARLAGVGIVCGVVGAFGVTRVITSLLYNVSATDPLSFVATAIFLACVAVLASYVPARRATAVDPMIALRME